MVALMMTAPPAWVEAWHLKPTVSRSLRATFRRSPPPDWSYRRSSPSPPCRCRVTAAACFSS